jgi:hypothetical protein
MEQAFGQDPTPIGLDVYGTPSNKWSEKAIVGGVAGACGAIILILLGVALFCIQKRRTSAKQQPFEDPRTATDFETVVDIRDASAGNTLRLRSALADGLKANANATGGTHSTPVVDSRKGRPFGVLLDSISGSF